MHHLWACGTFWHAPPLACGTFWLAVRQPRDQRIDVAVWCPTMKIASRAFRPFAALLVCLVGAVALAACSADTAVDADRETLVAQVEVFRQATLTRDFRPVVAMLAPRVLDDIASQSGLSIEEMVARIAVQTSDSMSEVDVIDFDMVVPDDAPSVTESGLRYAVLPTTGELEIDGTTLSIDEFTLAILEDNEWSLSRVEGAPQEQVLRNLYPELSDVDFDPR